MMEQGLRGEVLMDEVWVHAVVGYVGQTEGFLDLGGAVVLDEAFGHTDGKALILLLMKNHSSIPRENGCHNNWMR
jgi:hypothetical protein